MKGIIDKLDEILEKDENIDENDNDSITTFDENNTVFDLTESELAIKVQQSINTNTRILITELENINHYINKIDTALMDIQELDFKLTHEDNRVAGAVVNRAVRIYRKRFELWRQFLNEDLDKILDIIEQRNLTKE